MVILCPTSALRNLSRLINVPHRYLAASAGVFAKPRKAPQSHARTSNLDADDPIKALMPKQRHKKPKAKPNLQRFESLPPLSPIPVKAPSKPAKDYFPPFIQKGPESFLSYYCKRFSLELKERAEMKIVKQKGKNEATKWTVHFELPHHSLVDVPESKDVERIWVFHTAPKRVLAQTRARELFLNHLLNVANPTVIKDFIEYATPIKMKIQEMLDTPARISLSDDIVAEAQSLFKDLETADAFRISERVVLAENESTTFSEDGSHGRKKHQMSVQQNNTGITNPASITVPSELDSARELPMYSYYSQIMAAIDNNPVTILSASTGAGKTTQLPKFILAHHKMQRDGLRNLKRGLFKSGFSNSEPEGDLGNRSYLRPPNVIVTQPRRIAAISVAQRVAKERGEQIGRNSAIGYSVRFNSVSPKSNPDDGQVVFCTSGILLKRLQEEPNLDSVTHIILDEVHERDLNTDLLLVIVRQLLKKRPDLKVILMSATADTTLFSKYFSKLISPPPEKSAFSLAKFTPSIRANPPPIVTVPGRTFPVKEFYLGDVIKMINGITPQEKLRLPTQKYIRNEMNFEPPRNSISAYMNPSTTPDYFPVDLFEAVLAQIHKSRDSGAILVFLPGWQEIQALMIKLKEDYYRVGFGDSSRVRIYALHSSVSSSGQEEVFERPPEGVRKIILSTNIAETSVTINDIVYVVDSGKLRINTYDPSTRISSLNCVVASQSNLKQRAGRAGRCQPGEYYSLISERHRQSLPFNIPPELLRVDLQSTALKIKALNLSPFTADVLALAPQPPSTDAVLKAIRDLHTLGALVTIKVPKRVSSKASMSAVNDKETLDGDQEVLTPLGKALVHIPMDPWLAKLVVVASAFKALDPVLSAACVLEAGSRSVHAIHPDEKEKARLHLMDRFVCGRPESHGSDLLAMVTAYWDWRRLPIRERRGFALQNYLNNSGLENIERAKKQVLGALNDLRVLQNGKRNRVEMEDEGEREENRQIESLIGGREMNAFSGNVALVRALISASLFPNVAEAREKNVYGSALDGKLKLTGSTINAYSSLQMVQDAKSHMKRSVDKGEARAIVSDSEDTVDLDDEASDLDELKTDIQIPVIPPRFLSYHEKQMLEGAVWLRTTTIAEPIGLLLFSSFGSHESRLNWIHGTNGNWIALLGGWLRIEFTDEKSKVVVELLRSWIDTYLNWVVAEREQSSEQENLRDRLLQLVSKIVDK